MTASVLRLRPALTSCKAALISSSLSTEIEQKRAQYEAKYAHLLQQKAKEAGLDSIEELKARRLRPAPARSFATPPAAASTKPASKSTTAPQSTERLPIKPLSKILDLDRVMESGFGSKELEMLWTAYHTATTGYLSAVIPVATYKRMLANARRFPEFVVPLARGEGVELWLLQWARPTASVSTVLFTPLAAYHARGTYATPALVLTHYADLLGSHEVALMRGERSEEMTQVLSAEDAKLLVWRLQRFYNTAEEPTDADGKRYRALLEDFHRPRREDEPFDVSQLAKLAYEV